MGGDVGPGPRATQQQAAAQQVPLESLPPKEQAKRIRMQAERELESLRQQWAALGGKQRRSIDERRQLKRQINQLLSSLRANEEAQEAAINQEHFEVAQGLMAEEDRLKERMAAFENEYSVAIRDYEELLAQKVKLSQEENRLHQQCATRLADLKFQNESQREAYWESRTADTVRRQDTIQAESERIRSIRSHVELDLQLVEEEEGEIQGAIGENTRELSSERDKAKQKFDSLQSEIDALMQLVRAKQDEQNQCKNAISSANDRIRAEEARYAPHLQRLAQKRQDIQELEAECLRDEEALREEQARLEDEMEKLRSEDLLLNEGVNQIQNEIDAMNAYVKIALERNKLIGDAIQRRQQLRVMYEEEKKGINEAKDKMRRNEEEQDRLSRKLLSLQREAAQYKLKVAELEAHIPELEREKALTGLLFKTMNKVALHQQKAESEGGAVSSSAGAPVSQIRRTTELEASMRALREEKSRYEMELHNIGATMDGILTALERLRNEQDELKGELDNLEFAADTRKVEMLQETAAQLSSLMAQLAARGETTDEIYLLRAELEDANLEIAELDNKWVARTPSGLSQQLQQQAQEAQAAAAQAAAENAAAEAAAQQAAAPKPAAQPLGPDGRKTPARVPVEEPFAPVGGPASPGGASLAPSALEQSSPLRAAGPPASLDPYGAAARAMAPAAGVMPLQQPMAAGAWPTGVPVQYTAQPFTAALQQAYGMPPQYGMQPPQYQQFPQPSQVAGMYGHPPGASYGGGYGYGGQQAAEEDENPAMKLLRAGVESVRALLGVDNKPPSPKSNRVTFPGSGGGGGGGPGGGGDPYGVQNARQPVPVRAARQGQSRPGNSRANSAYGESMPPSVNTSPVRGRSNVSPPRAPQQRAGAHPQAQPKNSVAGPKTSQLGARDEAPAPGYSASPPRVQHPSRLPQRQKPNARSMEVMQRRHAAAFKIQAWWRYVLWRQRARRRRRQLAKEREILGELNRERSAFEEARRTRALSPAPPPAPYSLHAPLLPPQPAQPPVQLHPQQMRPQPSFQQPLQPAEAPRRERSPAEERLRPERPEMPAGADLEVLQASVQSRIQQPRGPRRLDFPAEAGPAAGPSAFRRTASDEEALAPPAPPRTATPASRETPTEGASSSSQFHTANASLRATLQQHGDHLRLGANQSLQRLFRSDGGQPETVTYSEQLEKIGYKSGKPEPLVIAVTDRAVYALAPKTLKLEWRVELLSIARVSAAGQGDKRFALHIPSDRDFLLRGDPQGAVIGHIRRNYETLVGQPLPFFPNTRSLEYRVGENGKKRIFLEF